LDAGLTNLLCKEIAAEKSKAVETGQNLAELCEEGCGLDKGQCFASSA
jgi:hypothetical protein